MVAVSGFCLSIGSISVVGGCSGWRIGLLAVVGRER